MATKTAPRKTDSEHRTDELLTVARNYIDVHTKWQEDYGRQTVDETYKTAIQAVFESFEGGDIPDAVRALEETLEPLANEYDYFLDNESELAGYPQQAFWAAYEKFAAVLEQPNQDTPLRPLETIKELNDQKVSHNQIAKMYGLVDARGEPEGWKIQKELDNPGSIIGPNWKDPRVRELEAKRSAASRHAEALCTQRNPNPKAPPCPETPRDLWEQKVSIEQSAKMLQVPEDQVRQQFAEWDDEVHQATKEKAAAVSSTTTERKPVSTKKAKPVA